MSKTIHTWREKTGIPTRDENFGPIERAMQREIDELREAITAEEAQTQTASKWPIAGIKVKIDDGYGPNFHLYRLLGANDLAPGEYELFTRAAQPPAGERAPLTDDDIEKLWVDSGQDIPHIEFQDAARMIEAHHGIKPAK